MRDQRVKFDIFFDQIALFRSSHSNFVRSVRINFRETHRAQLGILRRTFHTLMPGKKVGAGTLIRKIFVWTAREIVVAIIIFRGIEAWRTREAQKRIQDPYLTIKLNPSTRRRSCAKKYFTSCLYVSAVTLTPNPIFPIGSLVGIRC